MRGAWYKETYAYKVFAAGMNAYISKLVWGFSRKYPEEEYFSIMSCRACSCVMGSMAILQVAINVGLIGDMWDKKRKRS